MKKSYPYLLALLTFTPAFTSAQQPTPAELLERAIHTEDVAQSPEEAAKLYRQVIQSAETSTRSAQTARLRLARWLISQDQTDEANSLLKIVHNASSQFPELAREAQQLLETDLPWTPQNAPWHHGEVLHVRTWNLERDWWVMDQFYHIEITEDAVTFHETTMGQDGRANHSTVTTDPQTLLPQNSTWGLEALGRAETTFHQESATVSISGESTETTLLPQTLHNQQVVQTLRAIPWAENTPVTINTFSPLGGITLPITCTAVTDEIVLNETTWAAWKIQTTIGQTYWIEKAAQRRLLQMKAGTFICEHHHNYTCTPGQPTPHTLPGITLDLPHNWFLSENPFPEENQEEFYILPSVSLGAGQVLFAPRQENQTIETLTETHPDHTPITIGASTPALRGTLQKDGRNFQQIQFLTQTHLVTLRLNYPPEHEDEITSTLETIYPTIKHITIE